MAESNFDVYGSEYAEDPRNISIVYIHGGLWVSGSRQDSAGVARRLSDICRLPVVVPGYDLSSRGAEVYHPQHKDQVLSSINKYFEANSSRRLVLYGHSVGALMAGLIVAESALPVVGVVGLESIWDTRAFTQEKPEWKDEVLISHPNDELLDLCPQRVIKKDSHAASEVKWLIMHSTEDAWVDVDQSVHFEALLNPENTTTIYDLKGDHNATLNDDRVFQAIKQFIVVCMRSNTNDSNRIE